MLQDLLQPKRQGGKATAHVRILRRDTGMVDDSKDDDREARPQAAGRLMEVCECRRGGPENRRMTPVQV